MAHIHGRDEELTGESVGDVGEVVPQRRWRRGSGSCSGGVVFRRASMRRARGDGGSFVRKEARRQVCGEEEGPPPLPYL